MQAVALLRGINVGGKAKVPMAELRATFTGLAFDDVATYINSGNVLFVPPTKIRTESDLLGLTSSIEQRLADDFGFPISVVLRSHARLAEGVTAIPPDWVNDDVAKADVLFLRHEVDEPTILDQFRIRPGIDDALYAPGLVVWRVSRKNQTRSGLLPLLGTDLYRRVTIRNVTTARRLLTLLDSRTGSG